MVWGTPFSDLTTSSSGGSYTNSFNLRMQTQVLFISDSVYSEVNSESEDYKADIGSLMAVAAVGSQYANAVIKDKVQETFHNVARFHFQAVITQRPLEAIKVCTLLCMYNVFGKATVSLDYSSGNCSHLDFQSRKD